jgi:hypothetical protein|tara:strand:+ start:17733 stop:18542 length:810 start_codon:yes stop_codon:yes gene_type:complete
MPRNANRVQQVETQAIPQQPLTYSPPTTHVSLPTGGKFYPPEHSLHGKESVEIKQMTTREEEILTNQSLIKQGLLTDRLIQSVLLDKQINPESLFIGDKNAILIALRIDGYGPEYNISLSCPSCGEANNKEVDLSILGVKGVDDSIETTERGTFIVDLPRTGAKIELRLLTGLDEKKIAETNKKTKKYGLERPIATQYAHMIVSVNENTDQSFISGFAADLPAFDSRVIRNEYKKINPDVDMSFDFQCDECNHEQGLEVPITANFFWVE